MNLSLTYIILLSTINNLSQLLILLCATHFVSHASWFCKSSLQDHQKIIHNWYYGGVWIRMKSQCLHLAFPSSSVFLMHTGYTVQETLCTVHVLFTHCSWDPQPLYSKNIKNRSHDTIYTFKNYFATVFSVSVFSFQQNKRYLNEPYIYNYSLVGRKYSSGFPHISKPAATTYNFGFQ